MSKKRASAVNARASRQAYAAPAQSPTVAGGVSMSTAARWLIVLALLLGLVLGAVGSRFWFKDIERRQHEADLQKLQLALHESQAELAQTHARVDALQGQLVVEESTGKGLQASLKAAQAELGQARDQLAFFDELLPPGPAGSIGIRALDIEQQGPTLKYRVLLMRNGANDAPFKGIMQFVAKGSQQGKTVKIPLQAAQLPDGPAPGGNASTNGFELSFDQFQRGAGLLSIPKGFTPQTVTLNVLEGNVLRVSRTVNLPAAD